MATELATTYRFMNLCTTLYGPAYDGWTNISGSDLQKLKQYVEFHPDKRVEAFWSHNVEGKQRIRFKFKYGPPNAGELSLPSELRSRPTVHIEAQVVQDEWAKLGVIIDALQREDQLDLTLDYRPYRPYRNH